MKKLKDAKFGQVVLIPYLVGNQVPGYENVGVFDLKSGEWVEDLDKDTEVVILPRPARKLRS